MLEFHIDIKKNTILLIVLLLLTFGSPIFLWYEPVSYSVGRRIAAMILPFGYCVFQCVRCICDYKTTIIMNHTGFVMFRRGKHYNLEWNQIKRIEYNGVKWCRLFDILVIHTVQGKLYIEYTFSNYREAWNILTRFLSEYSPDSLVGKNMPNE